MKTKDNTEERLEEVEQTIQERLAYMAGIIDGEGCICMTKGYASQTASGYSYKIRLTVCNTSIVLLDWLVENFGGNYTAKKLAEGMELTHAQSYNWNLHCEQAGKLLNMVTPYLVIKKQQAQLALAYRKIQQLDFRGCPGRCVVPKQLREEIFLMSKLLNRRGPESVETNTPDVSSLLMKIESELARNSEIKVGDNLFAIRDQLFFISKN